MLPAGRQPDLLVPVKLVPGFRQVLRVLHAARTHPVPKADRDIVLRRDLQQVVVLGKERIFLLRIEKFSIR